MSAQPLLEVNDVSAAYGDIRALWGVSLSVWPGQATVVLGPNGAGKTTTLLTVAGLLRARSGTVRFQGQDVTSRPAHARTKMGIALVQENKRVFRRRSVEQNLLLGGYTLERRDRKAAIQLAYDRFPQLAAFRKVRAGALSGGQQQMLAIAQALIPGPSLLLLDEPSAGLAPIIVKEVMENVTALKASGIGVLLVEQLVEQAMAVADHVVLLDRGRVARSSSSSDVRDLDAVRDVYLGKNASAHNHERTL